MISAQIVFADALASTLGVSEDKVFEMARTMKLPFAVSTSSPRRLFIAEKDIDQWRKALKDA
jgi:hypothetical protein